MSQYLFRTTLSFFGATLGLAWLLAAPAATLGGAYSLPDTKSLSAWNISTGGRVPTSALPAASGLGAINVPAMRAAHPQITGAGQTVVVIDTGIDYTHSALAPNYLGGYDFVTNTADPIDNWAGGGGHGTHVAGIIASASAAHPGVAPGAKIISLKVFDPATGYASDEAILSALSWVDAHKAQYNITTVNLSLGDSVETTWSKIPAGNPYDAALSTLKQKGVFVAVASGNDSFLYGQAMPAASRYAVSVGATYASNDWSGYIIAYSDPYVLDPYPSPDGQPVRDLDYGPRQNDIAFFTNRYKTATDGATSLMAPGIFVTSTVPLAFDEDGVADGYTDMAGTSMASPHGAGAAMLVRQALEEAGMLDPDPAKQVDQILAILQNTGTPLYDALYFFGGNNATIMEIPPGSGSYVFGRGTGEIYALIDLEAAVNSVLGVPEPATASVLLIGGLLLLRRRRAA